MSRISTPYRHSLQRFRGPWAAWLQILAILAFWIHPLATSRAVYVPDDSGVQPPYYWIPTYNGDTEPSYPEFNDYDGNGTPDWLDQFNLAVGNGTLSWWGGGSFIVDGVSVSLMGQYHPGSEGDRDGDGIPDSLDKYPDDTTNNSFYWGGSGSLNGTTYVVRAQWWAGSANDNNGNGIPDAIEQTLQNYSDPQLHWWNGGNFLLNGAWNYYSGQYFYGYDTADSDGDGIPDAIDPNPNDGWNGTYYYFGGGDWFINGILTHFNASNYPGYWSDNDGDGLPDEIDPWPSDWSNNTTWWNGGTFLISGCWTTLPGQNRATNVGDADWDGIPDDVDPYPNDSSNNTFWWSGGSFTVNNQYMFWGDGYHAGSGVDSDGDGIPDGPDPYPFDSDNGNHAGQFYWQGGNFTLNNQLSSWGAGYYDGYWADSDGDGIPDSLDSYPYDSGNGNYSTFYWGGGSFTVDNNTQNWVAGDYPGSWSDSDGDNIPDSVDPYPYDSNNGNSSTFHWDGGEFYVDGGVVTYAAGDYAGPADGASHDIDGDGIPDAVDTFKYDGANNTFYWAGATCYVKGVLTEFLPGLYRGPSSPDAGDFGELPVVAVTDPATGTTRYVGDQDGDGLPDIVDDYQMDATNRTIYWTGIVGYLDGNTNYFPEGYAEGASSSDPAAFGSVQVVEVFNPLTWATVYTPDRDGDGIPDDIDPYKDDPFNATYYYWPPLDAEGHTTTVHFVVHDVDTTFTSTLYGGFIADDDDDGIPDVVDNYRMDHFNANDTDQDGIPDSVEVQYQAYGMSLANPSDAQIIRIDGLTNLQAYIAGLPLNQTPMSTTLDSDGDGMPDVYEIINGLERYSTNFNEAVDAPVSHLYNAYGQRDSTGATMNDFVMNIERYRAGLSVSHVITDAAEYQSVTGHPPGEGVTHSDALDVSENDWDGDGISNLDEMMLFHTDPRDANSKPSEMDILQQIVAGNGSLTTLLNNQPLQYVAQQWLDWLQAHGLSSTTGLNADTDGDGLTNWEEFGRGLDPGLIDSDGDGIPDAVELAEGTDPLDPTSNSRSLGLFLDVRLERLAD